MRRDGRSKFNIGQLCRRLADPNVRLDDNSEYRVDDALLGQLYAAFVSTINPLQSPGLVTDKTIFYERAKHQAMFQSTSRSFLDQRWRDLVWRQVDAKELAKKYIPVEFREDFAEYSVEYFVAQLAKMGEFETIGRTLKKAGDQFHRIRKDVGYSMAIEYQTILEAFADEKE